MSSMLAAEWPLAFRESQTIPDGYDCTVSITRQRPGGEVRLEMRLTESMPELDDSDTRTALCGCTLHAPVARFATELATNTPIAGDAHKIAALRVRWPGGVWA